MPGARTTSRQARLVATAVGITAVTTITLDVRSQPIPPATDGEASPGVQ